MVVCKYVCLLYLSNVSCYHLDGASLDQHRQGEPPEIPGAELHGREVPADGQGDCRGRVNIFCKRNDRERFNIGFSVLLHLTHQTRDICIARKFCLSMCLSVTIFSDKSFVHIFKVS